MIHHAECIEAMAGMDPESVDAIVTDPPYGLEFMGKAWDQFKATGNFPGGGKPTSNRADWAAEHPGEGGFSSNGGVPRYVAGTPAYEFHLGWAEAAYRVAKPSAYLLAFGGTRTVHRMTCALEDAGWIIRDMLVWGYASGFPKSKASLKPAWEPIVMARKPGPLRMLAIDECRIGPPMTDAEIARSGKSTNGAIYGDFESVVDWKRDGREPAGRWPANIVLTDAIFDGGIEGVVGGGAVTSGIAVGGLGNATSIYGTDLDKHDAPDMGYGDTGTYSRFFLVPKAARSDREPVLGGLPLRAFGQSGGAQAAMKRGEEYQQGDASTGLNVVKQRANVHPTVKPVDLMRHLVRLVTPTGGTVLDPFLGSGTTALAAEMEGFAWIGIEREAEYVAIAEARLNGTQKGMAL